MDYVGNVIRPPSEAYSMILQVTVGCSHNCCTFCGAYKGHQYYMKDMDLIKRDIDEASQYRFKKVFLADGDVLIMPTEKILEIMNYVKSKNPQVERFGVYGNTKAIIKKSISELKELKAAGLGIVYQGIESGNEKVLRKIKKGALPHRQRETAAKVIESGILLSQTVLLGIGGTELSKEHAIDTGKHLGAMSPDYASALTVMLLPNTQLWKEKEEGRFNLPDKFGLLGELKLIVENMEVSRECLFTSNHASNYLPIRAFFPRERNNVIAALKKVISSKDEKALRSESMRAL